MTLKCDRIFGLWFLLFFVMSSELSGQDNVGIVDSVINSGEYYPFIRLTDEDTLVLPVNIEIELYIKAIRDLNIKSNYFYAETSDAAFFKYDSIYVSKSLDTIHLGPHLYRLLYPESEQTYVTDWSTDGFFSDIGLFQYSRHIVELNLPHKWNLRDYPFDEQYLKIRYRATDDTSFVRLSPSKDFPPSLANEFPYLLDGFSVEGVSTKKKLIYKSKC